MDDDEMISIKDLKIYNQQMIHNFENKKYKDSFYISICLNNNN
jgi:hypothetical protein